MTDMYDQLIEECFNTFKGYRKDRQRSRQMWTFAHVGKYNYKRLTMSEKKQLLQFLYNKLRYKRCCDRHNIYRTEMDRERRRLRWNSEARRIRDVIASGLGDCACCGSKKNLTIDHILPVSKGGKTEAGNLQILCGECNNIKADKLLPGLVAQPFITK